jgi:adenine-specific DNA-methyltransferase
MCDEIFGRKNFVSSIIWEKVHTRKNSSKYLSSSHDFILCYTKSKEHWKRNLLPRGEANSQYSNPDNDFRGPWKKDPIHARNYYSADYVIKKPNGTVVKRPIGRYWCYSEESINKMIKENRILWGDNDSYPMMKRFLNEVQDGLVPITIWKRSDVGDNSEAKNEVKKFNSQDYFITPKPERLIAQILEISSNPGDLVLDSFAGSGTTGAVAHKMGRKWIMIEFNGPCHSHIIPRMEKVINGEDAGGVTEMCEWKGGGGFRYCEMAPSLLERNRLGRWSISKKYNPAMLAEAVCMHAGYKFVPKKDPYWMHGYSTERDFIYVTARTLTQGDLERLSVEVGEGQSLMVYCEAFRAEGKEFENLTVRKIPKAILNTCTWGKDDYSLKVALTEEANAANRKIRAKRTQRVSVFSGRGSRTPMAAKGRES